MSTPDKQAAPSEWVKEARRCIASYACAYSVHRDLSTRDCPPGFLASVKATLEKREQEMLAHLESREALVKQLAEALAACVDMAWSDGSHCVEFDSTVLFGPGYDFSGVDGFQRQEFLGAVECIVWPSGGLGPRHWSAYCTHDGSLWFEKFDSAAAAKEACMQLLDRVLPDHPAMKARAALAAYQEKT